MLRHKLKNLLKNSAQKLGISLRKRLIRQAQAKQKQKKGKS